MTKSLASVTTRYKQLHYCVLHWVRKKSVYSRHNFNKLTHNFVIFGVYHPDTSTY